MIFIVDYSVQDIAYHQIYVDCLLSQNDQERSLGTKSFEIIIEIAVKYPRNMNQIQFYNLACILVCSTSTEAIPNAGKLGTTWSKHEHTSSMVMPVNENDTAFCWASTDGVSVTFSTGFVSTITAINKI